MRQCAQHSAGTSAKRYASPSSLPLATRGFFVSPSKCLLWPGYFFFFSAISFIRVLQLTKNSFLPAHKGSYVLLCVALVLPVSLVFWQSCGPPCFHIPPTSPRSSSHPRNNVSKCSSARWWMGTIFNTTSHLSNPRQAAGGGEGPELWARTRLWRAEGLGCLRKPPAWGWISHGVMETACLPCFLTPLARFWWGARNREGRKDEVQKEMQFGCLCSSSGHSMGLQVSSDVTISCVFVSFILFWQRPMTADKQRWEQSETDSSLDPEGERWNTEKTSLTSVGRDRSLAAFNVDSHKYRNMANVAVRGSAVIRTPSASGAILTSQTGISSKSVNSHGQIQAQLKTT